MSERLSAGLRVRLSAMFFLEFAVVGAWVPVLWPYLVGAPPGGLGFTEGQAAFVYGLAGLATIVAPLVGGQIVDRWVPAQWYMAGVFGLCGAVLLAAWGARSFGRFWPLWACYAVLGASAKPMASAVSFHHLPDADRQFGGVRVWGAVGFIASGLGLTAWRWVVEGLGGEPVAGDALVLAGGCALALAATCLFLPHTPPSKAARSPWAALDAVRLLRHRPFALFVGICLLSAVGRQTYYLATAEFLERGVGLARASVPGVMTLAQIAEVVTTAFLLRLSLTRLGFRRTLVIGAAAWPMRFLAFALYRVLPWPVVVGALSLHGLAFPFLYLASQLYVNRAAARDVRASAQALYVLVVFGVGTFAGTQLAGWLVQVFSHGVAGGVERSWSAIFLVPAAVMAACAVALWLVVEEPQGRRAAADGGDAE